jgi:PAS domain S-box-containing protein
MPELDTTLYYISAILQLAAMLFAVRMMREARDRRPWAVMLAAVVVMFGARIIAITVPAPTRLLFTPFIACAISLLLLIALFAIRRVAVAERMSRAAADRNAAERDATEERYRSLVEASPDVLFVNDQGKIAYANAMAVRFFGAQDLSELIGRSPLDFVAPNSRALVESRIKQLTLLGGNAGAVAEDWVRLDGTIVPAEAIAAAVPWRGGHAIQVILRDISERVRAEEEKARLLASERAARSAAEHASRMKDEFLATLSHELRTPLNAIVGWSHLLLQDSSNAEDLKQGLSTIERNARVQARLIEDLLDMSRIISGKLRMDFQRVLPSAFIEAAIGSVMPTADAKGIQLEKDLDPLAGPVSGDGGRLQQVVWNLLSNAIKFTPRGGTVRVALKRNDQLVEILVSDTGQGIAPEFLPFVFDRFRQADASTTRRHGGLGIGLAIAKQLVELHGGSIAVDSPGEGQGSRFLVTLPLMGVPVQTPEPAGELMGAGGDGGLIRHGTLLEGLRVLVVDDEEDSRELVKRVLEDCKARVVTAGSAAEAVPILEADHFHVLVSDIGMPKVDGYEFLRQVRELKPEQGGRIPAIALTAFARSEDRTRALMSGYQVHVAKPVEPAELVATVASVAGVAGGKNREPGD